MLQAELMAEINIKKVVPLSKMHLHACLELDELTLNGLWSKEQWEKELTDSRRLCLGVINSSKLLALACGWLILDELHLTAIAVHPAHRRQGYARLVLSNLLKTAQLQGAKRATLEVSNTNSAAKNLYSSCGFLTVGSRNKYYQDGSDALIQWQDLKK